MEKTSFNATGYFDIIITLVFDLLVIADDEMKLIV